MNIREPTLGDEDSETSSGGEDAVRVRANSGTAGGGICDGCPGAEEVPRSLMPGDTCARGIPRLLLCGVGDITLPCFVKYSALECECGDVHKR